MEPAVVMAQGSWHTPTHYADLVIQIQKTGITKVMSPHLPSARLTKTPFPTHETFGFQEDATFLRAEVERLADAGHPILLMMHSSGGLVGNNACEGLLWPQRQTAGKPGGVIHLIYFGAFLFRKGTAIATPFDGVLPPWLEEDTTTSAMDIKNPRMAFFSHLSDEDADYWLKTLTLCSSKLTRDVATWEPYEYVGNDVDATCLVLTGDLGVSIEKQEQMANLLGDTRRMESIDSGHCAMIGAAEEMALVVKRAWDFTEDRLKHDLEQ